MHSIRTKNTILTVVAITTAMLTATIISAVTIANLGHSNSEELLKLKCEEGQNNIEAYFKSVEQSIDTLSSWLDDEVDAIDTANFEAEFAAHVENSKAKFANAVYEANGVFTYYYRIDPTILPWTSSEEGYWYTNLDGKGFLPHDVTPLNNESYECKWFYDTKTAFEKPGKESQPSIWLAPYFTDQLDNVLVISYNAAIHRGTTFLGVVGIEISYETLGKQIGDLKIHKTGCAYIVDDRDASLVYHPSQDLMQTKKEDRPTIPQALINSIQNATDRSKGAHLEYKYGGTIKHAYWLPLTNGMSIVMAVPVAEVNATWINLVIWIVVASVVILAVFIFITLLFSRHLTKPLADLTKAAEEINKGNYNVTLDYRGDDEMGVLTGTVNKLINHLADYIGDLNALAYADALTNVKNKSAFDIQEKELQARIDDPNDNLEFAIAMFDCDDLKDINDTYGHDKGDVYLKNACHLISRVFRGQVYRVGGDEFVIILQGEDYRHRESLRKFFIEKSAEICAFTKEPWEQIRVAVGVAVYNPEIDKTVDDVLKRADHLMYDNKHERKSQK